MQQNCATGFLFSIKDNALLLLRLSEKTAKAKCLYALSRDINVFKVFRFQQDLIICHDEILKRYLVDFVQIMNFIMS